MPPWVNGGEGTAGLSLGATGTAAAQTHWALMANASSSRQILSKARLMRARHLNGSVSHVAPLFNSPPSRKAAAARRKFLRAFPNGFRDKTYIDWEQNYKWSAHRSWLEALDEPTFRALIKQNKFDEIAAIAIRIESRTNLLFSFEKTALRDAVRTSASLRAFALALFDLLHGADDLQFRFTRWIESVARLPRRKTRVLTWSMVTVFGFLAQPRIDFFLKPTATREAARRYGVDLPYASRPSWDL